jgi:hypothetical protein
MKTMLSDWSISRNTIIFKDDTLCQDQECLNAKCACDENTEISYDTAHSIYYITCQNKQHRHRVSDAIASRIEQYADIKKIIIKDKETSFVLTINVAQNIEYKKRVD